MYIYNYITIIKLHIFRLAALIIALLIIADASAATRTFTGPGNFSDVSKWNGGIALPAIADTIYINGACTIDNSVSTDNVAYGRLIYRTDFSRHN